MELETCIHCGMCAEACHFYEATHEAKYTPIHKVQLVRRVYRRELSSMRWFNRLFTRDITAQDLSDWQELVFDSCTECGRCDMMCPDGHSDHERYAHRAPGAGRRGPHATGTARAG